MSGADLTRGVFELGGCSRGQKYARSGVREGKADAPPDAPSRPRHEGNGTGEVGSHGQAPLGVFICA